LLADVANGQNQRHLAIGARVGEGRKTITLCRPSLPGEWEGRFSVAAGVNPRPDYLMPLPFCAPA